MGSYLPDKVFAVCSNQLNSSYKQLTVVRANQTVKLGSQNRVFLVEVDKKLTEDFTCKTHWCSGAGTIAFDAGVAAGLVVAVGVSAIPVMGWIIGGAIAIGCIAVEIYKIMQSPTCSQMIGFQESGWQMTHKTVRFDKQFALVKDSILVCKEGGIILPFISEPLAKKAAQTISNNNRKELTIDVLAGAVTGFILGYAVGNSAGIQEFIKTIVVFGAWMYVGNHYINPAANYVAVESNKLLNDSTYNKLKDAQTEPTGGIKPTDENEPDAVLKIKQNLQTIKSKMIENGVNKADIAKIDVAIAKAQENGGSFGMNKNPEAKEVFQDAQNGKYGKKIQDLFTGQRGGTGKNIRANYGKSIESKMEDINTNKVDVIKGGNAIAGVGVLAATFIAPIFGEWALRLGGDVFNEDASDSCTVNAKDY